MRSSHKNRLFAGRRASFRRNHLRLERLEARLALTASPLAVNDFYDDLINQPLEIGAPGILANDISASGAPLSAGLFSGPSHGTLELADDGSFVYQPQADYAGLDSFLYFANDGGGDSMLAAVTIRVGDGGPPPQAADDSYSLDEDGLLGVAFSDGVLANDTAAEGQTLSATVLVGPAHGSLTLDADGSLAYQPTADFNGTDSFTYAAANGAGQSASATATITVNAVNDKPTVANDSYTLAEDATLTVDAFAGLLANDADADSDVLTPTITSQPLHGAVTLAADGSFSYTPEANYSGLDGFSYLVSDGQATSDVASATFIISSANDTPVGVNDEYVTAEDTPLEIPAPGVLINDTDIDGDALSSILVNPPEHGTVTLGADGGLLYTPNANFNGSDGFSYLASDGAADSDATAVTIEVTAVSDAPIAVADTYATDEDTPLTIDATLGLLANDSDADGDPLTATLIAGAASGALTLNPDGSFNYAPNANFNGADSFTYQVSDGSLTSEIATAAITVNAVNDAPVAAADTYTTDEDTPLTIDATLGLLANDTDGDGDPLTATLIAGPASGALTLNPDGSFNYAPSANFNGTDSFTYQVSDGSLTSEIATATITINAVNDAPVAAGDSYTTDEDTPLTIDAALGLLANDTDADGDPLSATLIAGAASGSLTLNPDGSFNYAPNANFNGADSFTYQVSDGLLTSEIAIATIGVNAVNDAPTAADDAYSLDQRTTLTVDAASGVLANDSDLDGDALSAVVVTGPANGSLTLSADGSLIYAPSPSFSGTDSFVYAAGDGSAQTQATVTLTVNHVAQAPIAATDNYSTGEDVPLVVGADLGVLANDINPDGGDLTAEVVTGPEHGSLALNPDGTFSFTPEANFHGTDSFTYKAMSNGQEMISSANIVIEPLNDAPLAVSDEFTIPPASDQSATVNNVVTNDSDIDGDPLAANLVSGPAHGTLSLNADGTFNYTPEAGYSGDDTFRYQLFDGKANSNVATATLHVEASPDETPPPTETPPPVVNLPPVAVNDVFTTQSGLALEVPASGLLINDSDPEGGPMTASLFTDPLHGTVTLAADGSFSYTPTSDYVGMDAFLYRVNDGELWSAMAAVTIYVTPSDTPDEAPLPEPQPEPAPTPNPEPAPEPCHRHICCEVIDHVTDALAHARHNHHVEDAVDHIFGHGHWWRA